MNKHTYSPNTDLPADPSSLPDDSAVLKEMMTLLMDAYRKEQSLVAHLQHQFEQQLRHRFGRRSETIDWENGIFSKEVIEAMLTMVNDSEKPPAVKEVISYERDKPAKKGHGRQVIPDHLPRV